MVEVANTINSVSVAAVRVQVEVELVRIKSLYFFVTPAQIVVEHMEVKQS